MISENTSKATITMKTLPKSRTMRSKKYKSRYTNRLKSPITQNQVMLVVEKKRVLILLPVEEMRVELVNLQRIRKVHK